MANRIVEPGDVAGVVEWQGQGRIRCRQRLGGMLRYYYRAAA
jgi:hypothetical protein